jgi:DNA-binding NarL/FixJ family response regulator
VKRIMIVEDQLIVRQGLKMIINLDEDFEVVAEAANGKEAIAKLERQFVDLVLMDIRMPEMNGLEAAAIILSRWPQVRVFMLTTFNDDEYAYEALKIGACGFLLKTSGPHKLLEAIHSCLNGGIALHEEVAAKVMPRLLQQSNRLKQEMPLTPREIEIARLVGEGKTNKEISGDLHLSVGTIKNHLTQILQKLDLRDRTQLAIFAIRNDLV